MSKDRSTAGGAATAGAYQTGRGAGNRLPTTPRERKPALAALAVLLILAGALSTMLLVTRSGNRVDVVMMKHTVAIGQQITQNDITDVSVASDNSIHYVLWDQRGALTNLTANTTLVAGSLLVTEMLAKQDQHSAMPPGTTTVVGVILKPGHYPFKYLDTTDKVTIIGSDGAAGGTTGTGSAGASTSSGGTPHELGTGTIMALSGSDTLDVTLAVDDTTARNIVLAGDSITLIRTVG